MTKWLVTGGSGFLARAIYRRAEREAWDVEFTALSRNENQQTRLHSQYPKVRCVLGDIRNLSRLTDLAHGHDVLLHTAAMKRIPESEQNVLETCEVNIQGSINVAMAAHAAHVKRVIGISTDKAVASANLYGMTKAVMERVFWEADTWGETRFVLTRYGNVVGSTGSIVPIFQRQLAEHGRVKVTNPKMTRYWLSPDDAVDLVTDCAGYDGPTATIVPLPGAMSIGDLAATIAGEAIDIVGPRPGEKIHESLVSEYEAARSEYRTFGAHERVMLYPSHTKPVKQHPSDGPYAMTSDDPEFWITPEQMTAMIEDASGILDGK